MQAFTHSMEKYPCNGDRSLPRRLSQEGSIEVGSQFSYSEYTVHNPKQDLSIREAFCIRTLTFSSIHGQKGLCLDTVLGLGARLLLDKYETWPFCEKEYECI